MNRKFTKFGKTLTALAVIAWCGSQVLAQSGGGGGSGSGSGGVNERQFWQ